jgi:O-antigen ligase
VFHLTSFQLLNRAQSTASGLQRITVACDHDVALPENIITTDELIRYGCRHIALENIQNAQAEGNVIKELYRDDPNVSIRRDIYAKTLSIVREHFVTGIGFGSSRFFLGSDERGAGLNASNMFLEVWLGSGLIGLIAFVFVWVSIGMVSIRRLLIAQKNKDLTALYVFIFLSWIGLTIFNLFNAGLFLGFFWAWLAVAVSFVHKKINI